MAFNFLDNPTKEQYKKLLLVNQELAMENHEMNLRDASIRGILRAKTFTEHSGKNQIRRKLRGIISKEIKKAKSSTSK